eukprot:6384802-Amphidinium_carterae.1
MATNPFPQNKQTTKPTPSLKGSLKLLVDCLASEMQLSFTKKCVLYDFGQYGTKRLSASRASWVLTMSLALLLDGSITMSRHHTPVASTTHHVTCVSKSAKQSLQCKPILKHMRSKTNDYVATHKQQWENEVQWDMFFQRICQLSNENA